MKETYMFSAFSFLFFLLISFLKVSSIVGGSKLYFSGVFLLPAFAAFFSLPLGGILTVSFFIFKNFFWGGFFGGFPTLASALAFSLCVKSRAQSDILFRILNFFIRVFIPTLCILIFILHPVGRYAFLYSFYWLIPIGFYFFQQKGYFSIVFNAALTSTFLAHAVGTIIWLYTFDMSAAQWLALIPVVAWERLFFASGLGLTYVFVRYLLAQRRRRSFINVFLKHSMN